MGNPKCQNGKRMDRDGLDQWRPNTASSSAKNSPALDLQGRGTPPTYVVYLRADVLVPGVRSPTASGPTSGGGRGD